MKIDTRTLSPSAQESLRIRAVKAVLAGHTQVEVAGIFGVPRQTVGLWVKAHQRGGLRSLKAKQRGRPKGGTLRPWQAAQIVRSITDRTPDQLKLPCSLWTREAVGRLITDRFDIQLSVWTVGRYLAQWGCTPQKPVRRAVEQNSEQVRRWLDEEYPAIRSRATREGAELYWGDEMGVRSDQVAGRSYGRRGQTPVIPGTGQRFGCNMISAITNRGRLNFMVFRERFNDRVFLNFLTRLVRQVPQKVFLIVDGHPVHRAARVTRWVRAHATRIELFRLPSYSPDLNPDEMLNQDVKSNVVGRRRAGSPSELVSTVRGFLRGCQRQPDVVSRSFHKDSVRYATA
ncbi:MAG: IS630 family transposase [candidate division NC10 bacterium]|nr:IS630 family transposase [candidate division NC10 bacterium]MDE2322328.1 IS630 family transposase [candidate division NC10 bacterium]